MATRQVPAIQPAAATGAAVTTAAGERGAGLAEAVLALVAAIPDSDEAVSSQPEARARALARTAARMTATVSGGAALAPGPLGLMTLLPDLLAVWRLQAQLVADIGAVYGKSASLGKEQMLYCLFRHTAAHVVRDLVLRAGERFVVRRASGALLQKVAGAIGFKLAQRGLGKAFARYAPVVGAVAVAGYAYYDTTKVAATAMALFAQSAD